MENETSQVRISECFFFLCVCVCGNVTMGLFCFSHIVARSPSAYPK